MNYKRPFRSRRRMRYALAGLVCCLQTASAEVRTWTSASGRTIEAELLRVVDGQAMLRSSGGNEFAIDLSKLSAGDQAYLNEITSGTSALAKVVAPAAAPAPDKQAGKVAGMLFAFKEPQSLAGGLPDSIKLRHVDDAKFMLLQYGPEAAEVLYVVFDPPGPEVAADAVYVWSPSLTGFQIPRRIKSKPRKIKDANAYVVEIPVSTRFGDLSLKGNIELLSGVQDWSQLFVVGNFDIVMGSKSSSFVVSGFIYDIAVDMAEVQSAKPLRLLTDIALSVFSHPENGITTTELKMGQYNMIPGKNMMNEVKVVLVDEGGGKAEEHRMKINKDNLLSTILAFDPVKLKQGQKYATRAAIDLGPIFGQQTAETTFTLK